MLAICRILKLYLRAPLCVGCMGYFTWRRSRKGLCFYIYLFIFLNQNVLKEVVSSRNSNTYINTNIEKSFKRTRKFWYNCIFTTKIKLLIENNTIIALISHRQSTIGLGLAQTPVVCFLSAAKHNKIIQYEDLFIVLF